MTVENTSTWEQTVAHRPGTGDLLNGTKANITATVPPEMPAAEEWNQIAAQLVALAAVCPVLVASVTFATGTPSIAHFASVRTDLLVGSFTVTDNGVGDTSITWAAGTFPALVAGPMVSLNDTAGTNNGPTAYAITNGVRVVTTNAAGAATDLAFTVSVR